MNVYKPCHIQTGLLTFKIPQDVNSMLLVSRHSHSMEILLIDRIVEQLFSKKLTCFLIISTQIEDFSSTKVFLATKFGN